VNKLGKKYRCYKCGCKFYDLNKPKAICPRCGEDQANEETKKMLKRKRRRNFSRSKPEPKPLPVASGLETTDVEIEEYVIDMEDIVLEESESTEEDDTSS